MRTTTRADDDGIGATDRRGGTPDGVDGTALAAFGRRVGIGDRVRAVDVPGIAAGTVGTVRAVGTTAIRVRFRNDAGAVDVRCAPGDVDGFAPAV